MLIASCKVASFEEVMFPLILSGNPQMYISIFLLSVDTNSGTPELVRGNDYCKLRYHLLSESEFKVLVPSFGFQLLGSIQWSS
ncbi:hypothetical protein Tco_0575482 [Tanacetum coccineum]